MKFTEVEVGEDFDLMCRGAAAKTEQNNNAVKNTTFIK